VREADCTRSSHDRDRVPLDEIQRRWRVDPKLGLVHRLGIGTGGDALDATREIPIEGLGSPIAVMLPAGFRPH
jgi:hypothetical protein